MAHKLREAIVSEDFEQAASLRDQINKATLSGQIGDE
jgi:protein-arginine kinase activator protein McsA